MTNPNNMPDGNPGNNDGNPGNNYNPGDAQPYGNQNQYGNQQGYGAPQGQERVVYVEKAKKSGCLKYGLIALAVLVIFGAIAAAMGGGSDSLKEENGDVADGKEDSINQEISYYDVGEPHLDSDKVEVTVTSMSSSLGDDTVCVEFKYGNYGSVGAVGTDKDWSMIGPDGSPVLLSGGSAGGNNLHRFIGYIPSGVTRSAANCFEFKGQGEYKMVYSPNQDDGEKAIWVDWVEQI